MENITLGQIQNFMLYLIGLVGATLTIVKAVKTAIDRGFKPIYSKIDQVDENATKNYLVQQISLIEQNGSIDDVNKLRFYEQYEHYTKKKEDGGLGGNTYIKHEVERLQKEGKL